MTDLANALLGRSRSSFPADPLPFCEGHIRPGGRPYAFVGHEYLHDPLVDAALHRCFQKGAQGGFSVLAFAEATRWATQAYAVGYCFPDRDRMQAYCQGVFDPLINADPDLAQATMEGQAYELGAAATSRMRRKGVDNLRLKRIGAGTLWLLGLQKRADVKSIPLDAYILDEVDEVDQTLALWLRDRLLHSSFKRIIELSQPSVPDWGINAHYELSDQKSWQLRCPRCREWHILEEEWPRCLVHHKGQEWRIVCLHCGARLREGRAPVQAQWVPAHPGREISGYRFSQLYGPATTAAYLASLWAPCERSRDAKENFYNSILGLPFAGDKQPLSVEVVNKASGDWPLGLRGFLSRLPEDARPLILGAADIGDVIHAGLFVFFQDKLHLVELQRLTDRRGADGTVDLAWDQLYRLFASCHFAVIDGRPDHSQALKLGRAMGRRLALAYFKGEQFVLGAEDDGTGQLVTIVTQERTTAIDDMADLVKHGDLRLPNPKLDEMGLLRRHCAKLVKKPNPNTGRDEYCKQVENHYGLMLTYAEMAHKAALRLGLGPRADFDFETSTIGGSLAPTIW
jgi:hypothetical protein